eukprot:TRINITY_DN30638_c0_g1_i1.p1 TRINITY_DN30638_c0_g1~~TRINITY_DN30638_c0_g1_i1.p1  ORF type:complete len:448 (+),score=137.24 TRINITY_DN30638_c0_g1_i1:118-1461(+)
MSPRSASPLLSWRAAVRVLSLALLLPEEAGVVFQADAARRKTKVEEHIERKHNTKEKPEQTNSSQGGSEPLQAESELAAVSLGHKEDQPATVFHRVTLHSQAQAAASLAEAEAAVEAVEATATAVEAAAEDAVATTVVRTGHALEAAAKRDPRSEPVAKYVHTWIAPLDTPQRAGRSDVQPYGPLTTLQGCLAGATLLMVCLWSLHNRLYGWQQLRSKGELRAALGCPVEAIGRLQAAPKPGEEEVAPLLAPVANVACVFYQLQIVEEPLPEPQLRGRLRRMEDVLAQWRLKLLAGSPLLQKRLAWQERMKEPNGEFLSSTAARGAQRRILLDQAEGVDGVSLDVGGEAVRLSLAGELELPWTDVLTSVQVCTDPRVAGLVLEELLKERKPPVDASRVLLRERYLEPNALVRCRGELVRTQGRTKADPRYQLLGNGRHSLHPAVRAA